MFARPFLVGVALLAFTDEVVAQTREQGVATLREFLGALQAKDYERASTFLAPLDSRELVEGLNEYEPGSSDVQGLPGLVPNREISEKGIEILGREGTWGRLEQVIRPERAKRMADRAGVSVEQCYGLVLKDAESVFCWTGDLFKIVRCDDIGKLEPIAGSKSRELSKRTPPRVALGSYIGRSRGVVAVAGAVRNLSFKFVGQAEGCVIAQTPPPETLVGPGQGAVFTLGGCGPLR